MRASYKGAIEPGLQGVIRAVEPAVAAGSVELFLSIPLSIPAGKFGAIWVYFGIYGTAGKFTLSISPLTCCPQ